MSFTFPKSERLSSRKAINLLFAQGKRITKYPISCVYLINTESTGLQAGFTVSKRNFKSAVKRNRLKRLMREAYRLQKQDLKEFCDARQVSMHVFFIYLGKDLNPYDMVSGKISHLLERLQEVVTEAYAQD